MDQETFRELLTRGMTRAKKHGKANWPKILAALRKDGGIYSTTQVWEIFVKKAVNRYRTKEVLHKYADTGKIARVYKGGQYWWTANPEIVKRVRAVRSN